MIIIGVQTFDRPLDYIHTLRVRYNDNCLVFIKPADVDVLNGTAGNRLSIQVLKERVETKNIILDASYTFPPDDIKNIKSNLNNYEQISDIVESVVKQIDKDVLETLSNAVGLPLSTFHMESMNAETGTFIGDVHSSLAILINRQANLIAARTRRGAGNWCIVSPFALSILQSATTSAFNSKTIDVENISNIKYAGTLINSMRVYVNPHSSVDDAVLVGYKGNDIDAGAFFCPYNMLISRGVTISPETFEPCVKFSSRYGLNMLDKTSSSLASAVDYFGKVGINSNTLTFI